MPKVLVRMRSLVRGVVLGYFPLRQTPFVCIPHKGFPSEPSIASCRCELSMLLVFQLSAITPQRVDNPST
jgi:hypothetical protein